MARGLAWLFGMEIPVNFHSPYKAVNIIEFWRSWHITLSRFFRQYVYIPLLDNNGYYNGVSVPDDQKALDKRSGGYGGYFAVTADCENPEVAVKWLDYVWGSQESQDLRYWGIEGVTYDVVDGEKVFKDEIVNSPKGAIGQMRGLGCWLQPGAHSVLDFEEQHRPAAELSTEGTTEITQAQLEAIMEQAYAKARHRLNLTAFVGIGLKRTISGFLNAVQTVSGYESTLRRSIDADARGIVNIVDFMEFPTGRVQTVLIPVPFADTTTLDETAQSKDGGLFLELERFGLEWVQRVTHRDMSDKHNIGGGRRGYHRAMYRVNCQDASGSFRVVRTAGG